MNIDIDKTFNFICHNANCTAYDVVKVTGLPKDDVMTIIHNIRLNLDSDGASQFEPVTRTGICGLPDYDDYNITNAGMLCLISGLNAQWRMRIIQRYLENTLKLQEMAALSCTKFLNI